MRTFVTIAASTSALLVAMVAACGSDSAGGSSASAIIGCLDQTTSKYVSCQGDARCVDPSSGVEVGCAGGTPFQPGGGDSRDDAGPTGGRDTTVTAPPDTVVGSEDVPLPRVDTGGAVGPVDAGALPAGSLTTCDQVFACFDACKDDKACESQCTKAGTPQALSSFALFTACSDGNACATELADGHTGGYIACVIRFCLDTYQGCFGALVSGDLTCKQMLTCMNACEPTDSACQKGCGESGTLDAQLLYFDILACGEASCPGLTSQAWADCANAACAAELSSCNAD